MAEDWELNDHFIRLLGKSGMIVDGSENETPDRA
jgi:hypothetical protein